MWDVSVGLCLFTLVSDDVPLYRELQIERKNHDNRFCFKRHLDFDFQKKNGNFLLSSLVEDDYPPFNVLLEILFSKPLPLTSFSKNSAFKADILFWDFVVFLYRWDMTTG